jgi:hypothetical protein
MKTYNIKINIEKDRIAIAKILRINLPLMNMNEDMCQEIADVILCELMGILNNKGKLKQRSKR